MKQKVFGGKRVGLLMGLLAGLVLLLAGCAGAPTVTVSTAEIQQQFKGKTVAQALEETEATMASAKQQELAFYSPGFLR